VFEKVWKIVAGIVVLSLITTGVVYFLSEEKREMSELMQSLALEVQHDFQAELPRVREINRMLVLVVERAPRDEEAQFREQLVDQVIASDKYNLITWAKVEKVLGESEVSKWAAKFGLLPGSQPQTLNQAVDAMKKLDRANFEIDGVLFIEITQFFQGAEDNGFGSKIGVKATIWSRTKNAEVASVGPVASAIDSRLDLRYLSHAMSHQSIFWRLPAWLVLCCGLPWALIGLVRAVVKRRSNQANMGLLAGLTLLDALFAWVLIMAFGTSGFAIFGLVLVTGLMGYYNYDAVEYIQRRLL
jgi:hypothetical protein